MYSEYSKLPPETPIVVSVGKHRFNVLLGDIIKTYVLLANANGVYGRTMYDGLLTTFGFYNSCSVLDDLNIEEINWKAVEREALEGYLDVYYTNSLNKSKHFALIENMQLELNALKMDYKDKYGVDFDV